MMWRNLACAAAFGLMLTASGAFAQEPAKLPIRRVVLYKHGVGYFARQGTVTDNVQIPLRFKKEDMSDLLKSLTVLDLGGGEIKAIAYESTKTVDQQLAEYTFDLREAKGLPAILDQLRGSDVVVATVAKETAGRMLSIEKRMTRKDDAQSEQVLLSLLLPDGSARTFDLAEVSDVRFSDARLQADLGAYLKTLFSRHRRDEKEFVITSDGKGKRDIFVSYVRAQPVWKVSYRIVLPEKEKPLLQAWAIVDNVSEEDWDDVSLSLVSGLPVSFTMNLYAPWYVKRPEVSLQRETAVGPVGYEAGERAEEKLVAGKSMATGRARGAMMPSAAPAPSVMADAAAAGAGYVAPDLYRNLASQAAVAVAQSVGALFQYDIKDPVTIAKDRSALLPIASSTVDATAVAIYDESTRRDNPMAAVRIKNSTGLTLEGGPVTVIQGGTYSGEAVMDTFQAGDERYISYAVDLGTRVNPVMGGTSEDIYRVRIVRGVMYSDFRRREVKVYNLNNVEDRAKTIVIQHPFRQEWKLVEPAKPIETTPEHYRFETQLPANGKVEFKVTEEFPGTSRVALTNLNRDQILMFLQQKYIDEKTRKFLESVVDAQSQIADLRNQIAEAERQRNQINQEQARLRQNLGALKETDQERSLRARYVKQLETGEDQLEALGKRIDELNKQMQEKQKQLNDMLSGFAFETKV